jgi:hypothetical protein
MKSKLSVKLLGIGVVLAMLASLLIGITAAPVSAATNQAVFTPYSLPSNLNNLIGGVSYTSYFTANPTQTVDTATPVVIANPIINGVAPSPDGNTIYAWDGTNDALYESTNGGKSFATSLGINVTGNFVGMQCSPKFTTDGVMVLATNTQIWMITGGLASAVSVTGDLSAKLEGGLISAMDVGYGPTGQLAIFIGVNNYGITSITGGAAGTNYNYGTTTVTLGTVPSGGIQATASAVINATTGAITGFTITNPGSGYTGTTTTVAITNTLTGQVVGISGGLGGTGYVQGTSLVTIAAPGAGTTATATINVTSGAIASYTITNPGSGYTSTPGLTYSGGGSGASTAAAVVAGLGATGWTANLATDAGAYSNVLMFLQGGFTWAPVGGTTGNGSALNHPVLAVQLSPNYQSDYEVMAVYTNGGNTYLSTDDGNLGWNPTGSVTDVQIGTGQATAATIAAGTDYIANSSGVVLVGTENNTVGNAGLFVVKGRIAAPGTVSSPAILASTQVSGIAVSGPIATASVVVSSPGTAALNIATGVTASTVTFASSATYRQPTGTNVTSMMYAGANNAKLFVSSTGFVTTASGSSDGGAINVSTDNGNSFNQIGLISVNAANAMTGGLAQEPSFGIVNSTCWFSVGLDDGLFQSVDQGASWVRIFGAVWGSPLSPVSIGLPSWAQTFPTDPTWYIINATNIALMTSNNGQTYTPISSPVNIGGLAMIENDTYYLYTPSSASLYAGTNAGLYFSTRPYINATFTPALTSSINSVSRNSADTTHMVYVVGTRNGMVYVSTDGGVTFNQYGTGPGNATDRMKVSYLNGVLFCAPTGNGTIPSTNPGIFFWAPATSQWVTIFNKPVKSYARAGDGTLYAYGDWAGAPTPITGNGIYRSLNYSALNPDGSSAAVWGTAISGASFPNGTSTATLGTAATGYPGTGTSASTSVTTGVVVFASAATGNTLIFSELTSQVTNFGMPLEPSAANTSTIPQYGYAEYSFVDTYTSGPAIATPKDGTVLTTANSATLTWTAVAGAAGGSAVSNTSYLVQVSTSKDFTGYTTPVYTHAAAATPTALNTLAIAEGFNLNGGLDAYFEGNTSQTVGVNPPASTQTNPTLLGGTVYYWAVQTISPLPSRATVASFTTALAAVNSSLVNVNPVPANGASDVPVSNTTFTWPPVTGATGYQFVLSDAAANTSANPFAIIDYSANTTTNAEVLQETLKYNETYWWEVRAVAGNTQGAWTVMMFTTKSAPVATTATTPAVTQTIVVPTQPAVTPIVTVTNLPPTTSQAIPSYLLWAVIAVGAVLVIAVIVLIVRTRRMP